MFNYELSQLLYTIGPIIADAAPIIIGALVGSLVGGICVIFGIIVANVFWKARIHRYAKTEIVETLEYQKNKIEQLEEVIRGKDSTISDQRGSLKVAKIAALKIVGCAQ